MEEKDKKDFIEKVSYLSPLGLLNFYGDQNGITKIEFAGDCDITKPKDESTNKKETDPVQTESNESTENPHLQTCIKWFDQYFKDPSKLDQVEKPVINLASHGSKSFLAKVWQVLRKSCKAGEMITYGKLAALAGNSKASRSVGQAMRRNPFPILVPCHRVIKADAKIGSYSWLKGVVTKKWLLDHEKKFASAKESVTKS